MTKQLKKSELIAAIAEASGQSRAAIGYMLDGLEIAAKAALARGEAVTVPGLVKLTIRDRAARMGRNPATGATLHIGAKRSVAAKVLSDVTA